MSDEAARWQRVKQVFAVARQQRGRARDEYLASACEGDADLRGEVESLLGHDDALETDFLAPPHPGLVAPLVARDIHDDVDGRLVGPWRLTGHIADGGMGTVYRARRADDAYDQTVAVKVIRAGLESEGALHRFARERQALAALEHPNIARLIDGGTTADGVPYVVMEYVDGRPIDRYCDDARLTIAQRLMLYRDVCLAVAYAHSHLIVHRDIKPDNILVSTDGLVKLVDFGVAKLLDEDDGRQTRHTTRAMTPAFASPEQMAGRGVTTATDIYSLGVVLYELLCGRRPHGTSGTGERDVESVMRGDDARPPSTGVEDGPPDRRPPAPGPGPRTEDAAAARATTAAGLRRALEGDLDAIVAKALRHDPRERYATADALAEDLRRHAVGLPVSARKGTTRYRVGKFLRRHALGATAAALCVLALVGGLGATWWQARIAAHERDRARVEAAKASRVVEFLTAMLRSANPYEQGRDVKVVDLLESAKGEVDRDLANEPEVQASVLGALGTTYLGLGLFDEAEPLLRRALDLRKASAATDAAGLWRAQNDLAYLLQSKGDLTAADPLQTEALALATRVFPPDSANLATAFNHLGSLRQKQGRAEEAEQLQRAGLDIRRRLGADSPNLADSLNDLAVVLGTTGRLAEAKPLHEEAVAVSKRLHGRNHPDVAGTLISLAFVTSALGDVAGADPLYREAVDIRRTLLGETHPEYAAALYLYAANLRDEGRYDEALRTIRQVLALRGKTLPDGHYIVSSSLQEEGVTLLALHRPADAEAPLTESRALRRRALPEGHWARATADSSLGECYTALGRYADAERLLAPAYKGLVEKLGPAHTNTKLARRRLEALYTKWGKPEMARQFAGVE